MTGCPAACTATTLALMCANWALRSGCFEPSSALRLNWREKPSFTKSLRTVSALIGWEWGAAIPAGLEGPAQSPCRSCGEAYFRDAHAAWRQRAPVPSDGNVLVGQGR